MTARYLIGDVRDVMTTLPDGSVDLVLTSPPFLAQRSYLPPDHVDKHREIGSEPTPSGFLATLLGLTGEWRRLLAPHGSIAVELGDTYSGSGGAGGDYLPGGLRDGQQAFSGSASRTRSDGNGKVLRGGERQRDKRGNAWPLPKSLCGIPALYAGSLAYGRNLLAEQTVRRYVDDYGTEHVAVEQETSPAGQWRVRNLVAWVRPNPSPGELGDKFRPATSYMTIATLARDRWFDLDAVRTDPAEVKDQRTRTTNGRKQGADRAEVLTAAGYAQRVPSNPAGAPPLDWWEIPTHAYPGSHFATWPPALCELPIEAMCPRRVCRTCGTPSRRMTETTGYVNRRGAPALRKFDGERLADGANQWRLPGGGDNSATAVSVTVGWSSCGCPGTDGVRLDGYHTGTGWRPGVVLDPFAGSGTTLAVATGHARDCIGIDIDERNADLARERVGMWLEVVDMREVAA